MTKPKLYIIAHTWKDIELTIETFRNPEDCTKKLGELVDDRFEEPNKGEDPEQYLDRYNEWRIENEVDEPDYAIAFEIIEI